jgi:lysophospholipase L1-like esterase
MASTAPKSRLRWSRKILFSLISLVAFLGLCELVCWGLKLAPAKPPPFKFIARDFENDVEYPFIVEDATLLWTPKPGFRGRECYYGVDVRINSAGYRDREYPIAKGADVFRILCLGDSTTFGHALPIDDTYHGLLEEILNLPGQPTGLRYELINGGVPGYSSRQCLAAYEHRGRKLRPNMVFLYVGANDGAGRSPLSDEQLLARLRPGALSRIDHALSHSHAYRALRRRLSGPPEYGRDGQTTVPRVSPVAFKRNIAKLDQLCKADGCQLVLISFAYCSQAAHELFEQLCEEGNFHEGDAFIRSYHQLLEAAARERQIPLVIVPALTTMPDRDLFFDMFHPNRAGHLLLAITLERFLRDHGPLPPSTLPDRSQRDDAIREFLEAKGR